MGTGALALAVGAQAATWQAAWLANTAVAILVLATVLGVVLLPRYLRRAGNRAALAAELADPGTGAMLATLPAGLLVLAAGWGRLGPNVLAESASLWIDGLLLVAGTAIALTLGLAWSAAMLRATPGLEAINGGWLIPPVMNLLVPVALAPLIAANPGQAPLLLLVGFAFYGIGVILFLALLTLLIARLALRDPLPPQMVASMWIPLAPAGVVGLALMRLLQAGSQAQVPGFTNALIGVMVASMGIGFGLWWSAFALLELRRLRKQGTLPVHPGWWGLVFPVAAMTLSIAAVGTATELVAVEILGAVATLALVALWAFVAARTARMLRVR